MISLSTEQINQLAPDSASISAARGLAGKWQLLGGNDAALWGLCKGSGKNPYQTVIAAGDLVSKCSCPSRKFPCKHALSLLQVASANPEKIMAAESPDWVQAWLDKRSSAQEAKAARAEAKASKAADPKQQQKTAAARAKKVSAGLADLQLWLQDLLRNGIIHTDNQRGEAFPAMAKRLVDAQLAPLAQELQRLALLPAGQQEELLYGLSKLHLLARSYANQEQLSPAWQAEIKTRLGFPQAKEEILAGAAVADRWRVVGRLELEQQRGTSLHYYLFGLETKRFALLLDFTMNNVPPSLPPLAVGTHYDAELCFYAGINPLRALPKTLNFNEEALPLAAPAEPLQETWAGAQQAIAANPFLGHWPLWLRGVHYVQRGEAGGLSDGRQVLPLALNPNEKIQLLASSGGRAGTAFVLHNFNDGRNRLLSFLPETAHA